MLLQFRELRECWGTKHGEHNRNTTSDRFRSIQSSFRGDEEAFERLPTRSIGRFPRDHGGTVMEDLYGSALRQGSYHI